MSNVEEKVCLFVNKEFFYNLRLNFCFFSVIMPPSALDTLTRLSVVYPMLFKLTNKKTNRITHSGVLEFTADEGKVYLPYWVINFHKLCLFTIKNVYILLAFLVCLHVHFVISLVCVHHYFVYIFILFTLLFCLHFYFVYIL